MTETAREIAERWLSRPGQYPRQQYPMPQSAIILATAYLQALDRLALAEGVVEEAKRHVDCGCDCGELVASEHQDDPGSGDTALCASTCFNKRLPLLITRYEKGAKG